MIRVLQTVPAACLLLFACNNKGNQPGNIAINPAFEQAPPIASDVFLKQLETPDRAGNNVLLVARFSQGVVKERFHAVMAGDERVVLRDDGQGGDEKAGDGLFSVALKEDLASLQQQLVRLQALKLRADGAPAFRFANRSVQPVKEAKRLDTAAFIGRRLIPIDQLFDFTITDPNLRNHSLMITERSVVEDPSRTFNPCNGTGAPDGVWSFGRLMRELANTPVTGVSAEDFVRNWLDTWMAPRTVNSDAIAARTNFFNEVIRPWLEKSGAAPGSVTTANWKTLPIAMQFAPFKLLAIVNRLDLRGNSGYGFSNAGEGRFVFGALNLNTCAPRQFTVIFEFGINKRKCSAVKAFAQEWYNLKDMPFGAPFNTALQAITDQFALAGTNPSKPNGSSLNQLRTNEFALGVLPWELREFTLGAGSHLLEGTTVKQEPQKIYNRLASPPTSLADHARLAAWVNANSPSILNTTYQVPLALTTGEPFLGGKAHTEGAPPPDHFWDASASDPAARITDDSTRHIFSLNTCSGCHGGEGKTPAFTHVSPTNFGTTAELSPFLTGLGADALPADDDAAITGFFFVKDPANRPTAAAATLRGFNDLKRRAEDLQELVTLACNGRVFGLLHALKFKPLNMTH